VGVIAALAILWGVVGALLMIGLVWSRRVDLSHRRESQPGEGESGLPVAPDIDAEWIYGERRHWARPQEPEDEARREAEAIVMDAELKAREILSSAERARSHVEAELAREQARVAEKTEKLSRFLANALEEVERASANGTTASVPDLHELRALRDELRNSE
jgi:vacuolar-type H+-ATPase subunit H